MYMLGLAFGVPIVSYGLYCMYMRSVKKRCLDTTDLAGKTAIVTGSDKGIGYHTAVDLARRHARVILACRNVETAEAAAAQIRQLTGNENVVVQKLDLSALQSVRQFAGCILEQESRIDILINNAGTAVYDGGYTEDGLEYLFATNYIGPFLMTTLLLDRLKQSVPSRVVNVSSVAHKFAGPLDLTNLNGEKKLVKTAMYSHSKLALILFTRELSRQLQGSGVTVNALHPGSVQTNLVSHIPQPMRFIFMNIVLPLFFRSTEEGAQTSIHVAVAKEIEGVSGEYFSECRVVKPADYAMDDGVAKKLFELSETYANYDRVRPSK